MSQVSRRILYFFSFACIAILSPAFAETAQGISITSAYASPVSYTPSAPPAYSVPYNGYTNVYWTATGAVGSITCDVLYTGNWPSPNAYPASGSVTGIGPITMQANRAVTCTDSANGQTATQAIDIYPRTICGTRPPTDSLACIPSGYSSSNIGQVPYNNPGFWWQCNAITQEGYADSCYIDCAGNIQTAQSPLPSPNPYFAPNGGLSCGGGTPAPVVDLQINGSNGPLTVTPSANLNLTWGAVSNATSCTSTSGFNWSGSAKNVSGGNENRPANSVNPSSSTYTLSCTGAGGTTTDSVVVNVGGGVCGNMILENPETCDLGNGYNGGCPSTCSFSCTSQACPDPTLLICPTNKILARGASYQFRSYFSNFGGITCANLAGASDVTNSGWWFGQDVSNPFFSTILSVNNSTGVATGVINGAARILQNYNGYQGFANVTVASSILTICPSNSATTVGSTATHKAYYSMPGYPAVTCNGNQSATPLGANYIDVTGSSTWTSTGGTASIATVSGGVVTGVSVGTATFTATANGGGGNATGSASSTISAQICNSNCSASTNNYCTGVTFTTKNTCNNTETCTGTRSCDFNWKEVSP